jgi:hypothetical protein
MLSPLLHCPGMENARQRVHQLTIDIMRASRTQGGGPGMPQQYGMPQQVRIIPDCDALFVLPGLEAACMCDPVCLPDSQLPLPVNA